MIQRILRFVLVVFLLALLPPVYVHAEPRCFPEAAPAITACIDGRIRSFWEQQGGLPVFGYPLAPPAAQQTELGSITTQLFERARLELHPENAPPYDVLLGRLGADDRAGRGIALAPPQSPQPGCLFFAATGYNICPPFLATWQRYGLDLGQPGVTAEESLALFGLPLGPPQPAPLSDGQTYTVQWFERARFEDHGAQGVMLGLLGRELRNPPATPAGPAVAPANPQRGGFIEVSGAQLTRLGQPVTLKGVNYYPQGRPWADMWNYWDGPQVEGELRLARERLGINTLRILLPYDLSDDGSAAGRVTPQILTSLREMLQIAGSLDMRVIVTLFDFYEDFPPPGSHEEQQNLDYLRTLIGNFAGDDRIMAWDIHNEPDHYDAWRLDGKAQQVLDWLGRMADEIHRLAPNHLVTVGMGQYDNLWQPGPDGRRVIDYSDVVSVHIYNAADAVRQLDELRSKTAKPILLQEFGWPTGPRCFPRDYNEEQQAQVYRTILAAAEGRVAGVLAWTLRDYDAGPTRRWDTREEYYGLFRADQSLKPAAQLFQAYGAAPLPAQFATNLPLSSAGPYQLGGDDAPLLIRETGHYIKGPFLQAWQLFGGQGNFGLPLTEAMEIPNEQRKNQHVVQYFEGAVLEYQPEAAEQVPDFPLFPPQDKVRVLIKVVNIGSNYSAGRSFPPPDGRGEVFPETGYAVAPEFAGFYRGIGGKWRMGAPISGLLSEEISGTPTQVQYFQNGRLELNPATKAVEVGRLGQWALDLQCRG